MWRSRGDDCLTNHADGGCCGSQLSLAHFCENDGPTTILCTQVLPVSCASCWPITSLSSSLGDLGVGVREDRSTRHPEPERMFATGDETNRTGEPFDATDLQDVVDVAPMPATDLDLPEKPTEHTFEPQPAGRQSDHKPSPSSKAFGDDGGCVSCSISLPQETLSQLPVWAPGSPKKNGNGRNGSPVLRTTEKVVAHWSQQSGSEADDDLKVDPSSPASYASDTSRSSSHPHEFIYRTTSSPIDPNTYAILRRATIRTLSCEQLPRGLTSGALSFGDPIHGYTIAYKFRLPDPYARGCHRYYALLALAGQDPGRMYQATSIVWRAFRRIAAGIMTRTERVIVEGQTVESGREGRKVPMPVSSFLTGRTVDPDGYPRRSGGSHMRARGLAEMVGDDLIFAHVHGEFTFLLQNLGRQLGGMSVKPPSRREDGHDVHMPYESSEDGRDG